MGDAEETWGRPDRLSAEMRIRAGPAFAAATTLLLLAAGAAASDGVGPASPARADVVLKQIGAFDEPTYLTAAPGSRRLLFVTERKGVIAVIRRGRALPRPFLNISGMVRRRNLEQGLLGLAFPPDYRRSGRFYVQYTDTSGDIRIDEFRRRTATVAARSSRRPVLRIPEIDHYSNHNGGQLEFRGRLLYIGVGDGSNPGDVANQAQDIASLRGKILRINPRPSRRGRPYRVPRSNPFVGRRGRDEILAYGLRNPWRFSFPPRRGGVDRIVIGDVGQNRFEEIDYETVRAANGADFGWDAFEGHAPYGCGAICPNAGTRDPGGTVPPIHTYRHRRGACAVVGGYVVEDPALKSLRGRYVYADYCGRLRSLRLRRGAAAGDRPLGVSVPRGRLGFPALTSLGTDARGDLYLMSDNGPVYRFVAPRGSRAAR
jgi:glucose/arabinose dehydrogenase